MTIKKRLIVTFTGIICMAFLSIGISSSSLLESGKNLDTIQDATIPTVNEIGMVKRNLIATLSNTLEMMLLDDSEYIKSLKGDNSSHEKTMAESIDFIQQNSKGERLAEIDGLLDQIAQVRKELEALAGTDEEKALALYQQEFSPLIIKAVTELDAFTLEYTKALNEELGKRQTRRFVLTYLSIGLFIVGCIGSIKIIAKLVDSIMEPIDEVNKALVALSEGQLGYQFTYDTENEFQEMCNNIRFSLEELHKYVMGISTELSEFAKGNFATEHAVSYIGDFEEIGNSIDHVKGQISEIMEEMQSASKQVEVSSEQISSTSQELANGSVEQASAVEELTASINEILEQLKTSADRARETSTISRQAESGAVYGNEKVNETAAAIHEIEEKSTEIENIINIIDQIATQTRLLSLNASIEAARAGESGRGFAIVATEVGNLAVESAEAAKGISKLINDMTVSVKRGVELMGETEEALAKVVDQARGIDSHITEIAEASKEQAVIIEQISLGADQISAVVQSNSAYSEESATTAEELSGQAVLLENMIQRFRTKK